MPIETKVAAQGTTALTGAVLAQLVIQLLHTYAHIDIDTNTATEIVAFFSVIPGLIAGYKAPHTANPDAVTKEAQRLLEEYLASHTAQLLATQPGSRIIIPAPQYPPSAAPPSDPRA
jgi:hypothetical protein